MAVPSGRLQFFALEASDYLERLALILGRPNAPDPDELVRLTRALRGAALMAGLSSFAQAAAALEQVAKTFRQNPEMWGSSRTAELSSAVGELRQLTQRAPDWSDRESELATELARRLGESLGEPPAPPVVEREESDELKPSVRAFVGREGALIAGTLEHAAQALELGQPSQAADVVLGRLQPLRGLATLPHLSPLPEFLDAIELTIRALRDETAPPSGANALRKAAAAVTRLAREIADHGKAGANTPEVVLGAVSLLESFGRDDDVVSIESLFTDDDEAPIVFSPPPPPEESTGDSVLELVSLADRFRQAADQLSAPATTAGRTLYLYGLLVQLRPITQAAPRERPYLAGLLSKIALVIGRGRASEEAAEFAAALKEAAEHVGRAAEARNAVFLGDELASVLERLDRLAPPPRSAPVHPVPARGAPIVEIIPIDDDSDVVPIESLAPDEMLEPVFPGPVATSAAPSVEALPEPVPIESLAPEPTPGAFEQSFSTYFQLRTRIVPVPVEREPAPLVAPAVTTIAEELDIVSITTLLFSGRRALEQADAVRIELSSALKQHRPFVDIEPLVSELIDLVPLALQD